MAPVGSSARKYAGSAYSTTPLIFQTQTASLKKNQNVSRFV